VRARELLRSLEDLGVTDPSAAALAGAIGALVRSGRLPAGVELPSERDLGTALGRSRGTIARAYAQLRADGLAYTRQGAGTTIGCCAGPWASSRAAELEPVIPIAVARLPEAGQRIDLRSPGWGSSGPAPGDPARATVDARHQPAQRVDVLRRQVLGPQLDGLGLQIPSEQVIPVASATRALDVALATLLRPGERVLVPALTDPGLLALLRIRGLHPVSLPVTGHGGADLPAWLRRIRGRAAALAVVPSSHGAPAGSVLAGHERRLLVEAAAEADVTLLDDLRHGELWMEHPAPPPLADFDTDGRTVTLGSTDAATPAGAGIGWLHSASAPLTDRLRGVAAALDAHPVAPVVAAACEASGQRAAWLAQRRQHVIDHTAVTIRLLTPAAPQLSVAPAAGGPWRLLHLGGVPGTAAADAARERGVLVHPGAAGTVGAGDPSAVLVSLTGPIEELVTGLRTLIEVVRELA
jgi:DNA-binding transcriptional MocR family regulator